MYLCCKSAEFVYTPFGRVLCKQCGAHISYSLDKLVQEWYECGVRVGKQAAQADIKKALGL